MKNHTLTTIIIIFIGLAVIGCSKYEDYRRAVNYTDEDWEVLSQDLNLPDTVHQYYYREDRSIPSLKDRAVTLGSVLFYDKTLSFDGTVSCGSCHKQKFAFSDDVSFSTGVNGNLTTRNTYPIGSIFNFQHHVLPIFRYRVQGPVQIMKYRGQTKVNRRCTL